MHNDLIKSKKIKSMIPLRGLTPTRKQQTNNYLHFSLLVFILCGTSLTCTWRGDGLIGDTSLQGLGLVSCQS